MLKIIEAPTVSAVSLETVKAHLRVDQDNEDSTIEIYLAAAIEQCADECGQALEEATYRLEHGCWPFFMIPIPMSPVRAVSAVKYTDEEGDEQTVDPENYRFVESDSGGYVFFVESFEAPALASPAGVVAVEFIAGYDANGTSDGALPMPKRAVQAILLTVGHFYANREKVVVGKVAAELPASAKALLWQIRVFR